MWQVACRKSVELALALMLCGVASAAGYQMVSVLQVAGKAQSLLAWCDAASGVYALTQPQPAPPKAGKATFYQWPKGSGATRISTVTTGEGDGAAGSVFYPFDTAKPNAKLNNYVRISNIENVLDPAYRMTHVGEFHVGGLSHRCRYAPEAAFIGATAQRTVIIWENGTKATYSTRNFDGSAGVSVAGKKVTGGYRFTTPDGYTYAVTGAADNRGVEVFRGGKLLRRERFRVYSESVAK